MFASFHSEGTIPSTCDKLNTFASGVLICSTILVVSHDSMASHHMFVTSLQYVCDVTAMPETGRF